MGVCVLVLGQSGSGKSTSLRNFSADEIGIFNVTKKPLPFKKRLPKLDGATYNQIKTSLAQNKRNAYVIDDANYLMAFDSFNKARETGYSKFTDMAVSFEKLLEAAANTSDDTIIYFFMHADTNEVTQRVQPKTIGKMLDTQLCIEGLFPIVLMSERNERGYRFITTTDGYTPAKAPMGMLDSEMDNDLKEVDTKIREYWQMKIFEPKKPKKQAKEQQEKEETTKE